MKKTIFLLISMFTLFGGCMSSKVSPEFDLASDFKIEVYRGEQVLAVSEEDQATLRRLLRFWLPQMRTVFGTYPTPMGRLGVIGADRSGTRYEGVVFVGSNWIGDGRGVVTLADTEVFKLRSIIERSKANQSPEPTPLKRRGSS